MGKSGTVLLGLVLVMGLWPGDELSAQKPHEHHSVHADQADSGIAGLSAPEVEQLRNGEGMGQARAAELNHYPGPMHVLDAAVELDLSEEQVREIGRIFEEMRAEAIRLGEEIIEKERILSRRFEHRHIDENVLGALTSEIAALRGKLRTAHLLAHLKTEKILSSEQIAAYDILRGYEARSE